MDVPGNVNKPYTQPTTDVNAVAMLGEAGGGALCTTYDDFQFQIASDPQRTRTSESRRS